MMIHRPPRGRFHVLFGFVGPAVAQRRRVGGRMDDAVRDGAHAGLAWAYGGPAGVDGVILGAVASNQS
jgi:hypothetical protein